MSSYTYALVQGPQSFVDFVLGCQGACVRHEGANEEDLRYHQTELDKEIESLRSMESMTPAEIQADFDQYRAENDVFIRRERTTSAEIRNRLDVMLQQVKAWTPPTDKHLDMKQFMIMQLRQEIAWRQDPFLHPLLVPKNAEDRHSERIKNVKSSLNYHKNRRDEVQARITFNKQWIRDLRNSLGLPPDVKETSK